jgi:hypothetical protein
VCLIGSRRDGIGRDLAYVVVVSGVLCHYLSISSQPDTNKEDEKGKQIQFS